MSPEERRLIIDKIYQFRTKAEQNKGTTIETSCIRQAEELEQTILTPLSAPLEVPCYELMTVADFVEQVKHGCFVDYDGVGHYATETHESMLLAIPSQIVAGKISDKFTHVAWYNK